jgi:hypothetical protein
VTVKNFATNLEWTWTKEKFMSRKLEMTEMHLDFKEDGKINKDKFKVCLQLTESFQNYLFYFELLITYKSYDPFNESPDTPTQVGTAVVFPKSFAYLISQKVDAKIIDFRGKEVGLLNIEIHPCQADGKLITEKDNLTIKDPKVDLLNKSVNFIVKINAVKNLNQIFEDVYCQFQVFKDKNVYKTETVKDGNSKDGFQFKFSKQLTFVADQQV